MALAEFAAHNDKLITYLRAVVTGQVVPAVYVPSTLQKNPLVMEILDAARESARSWKTVRLAP